jgi:hypothetical protein
MDEPNFIRGITIFSAEEQRLSEQALPIKTMLVLRYARNKRDDLTELRSGIAGLRHARLIAVNCLRNVAWRDHLWHEPSPPDVIIELGFETVVDAERCFGSGEMSALCAKVLKSGGVIGAYIVDPRRMI